MSDWADKKKKCGSTGGCQGTAPRGGRISRQVVGVIILVIAGLTLTVLHHAKDKPESPQAMVAAALNQAGGGLQEWRPGMGPQPLVSKPVAFGGKLVWQQLYSCPTHGLAGIPLFGPHGAPHCPLCKQIMTVNR